MHRHRREPDTYQGHMVHRGKRRKTQDVIIRARLKKIFGDINAMVPPSGDEVRETCRLHARGSAASKKLWTAPRCTTCRSRGLLWRRGHVENTIVLQCYSTEGRGRPPPHSLPEKTRRHWQILACLHGLGVLDLLRCNSNGKRTATYGHDHGHGHGHACVQA